MEITTINKALAYQNSESAVKQTAGIKTGESAGKNSPAYRISISSAGRNRSMSSFNRSQQIEKSSFQRGQSTDKASKERELDNEKATFERSQAAEERNFESSQRLKKAEFMRNIEKNI